MATTALADCAQDLAALRTQMGVTASTGGAMKPADAAKAGATGEVSGVEATAEMSKAQAGGTTTTGAGAGTTTAAAAATAPAGQDTAAAQDVAAAAGQSTTFTENNGAKAQKPGQDSTGSVSGVAPTAALGNVASGGTANAAAGDGAAAASAAMPADAASASGMAKTGDMAAAQGSQMAMSQLQNAQAALDKGDEAACSTAVQAAKSAM